jgi:hypothetical protein
MSYECAVQYHPRLLYFANEEQVEYLATEDLSTCTLMLG